MKDILDKTKKKLFKRAVDAEVQHAEAMLGVPPGTVSGSGGGGNESTEPEPSDTDMSSVGSKIKKKLLRKSAKTQSKKGKKSTSSDGETDDTVESATTETPIQTSDGEEADVDVNTEHYSTPASQANSDYGTNASVTGSSDDESGRSPRKKKSPGKKSPGPPPPDEPSALKISPNKKTQFTINLRIIDATELQGFEGQELNPMVRVVLGKKCRKTRVVRGTDQPHWDQTISFTVNTTLEELATQSVEFSVYSAGSFLLSPLIGSFRYNLGLVFKSPKHRVLGKWLSLRASDDDDAGGQIRGFLRICIGITYPGFVGSNALSFKEDECEVVDAADAMCYRLQFRVYKLQSLMYRLRYTNTKTPDAACFFAIEVCIGKDKVVSHFCYGGDENIAINEELLLPIMWPSVTRKIRIRILSRKHAKSAKSVVCTAFLDMKSLCQSGDNGYLPLFGPSFINFFGPNPDMSWSRGERKRKQNGEIDSQSFYGRLLCELDCTDARIQRPTTRDLPNSAVIASETYYMQRNYTLFASLFAANEIHPEFKSKNVQFTVSIGEFGNPEYDYALRCTDSTLPTMPIYDTTRYYSMPWGTHKPVCEVQCCFEDISPRVSQASSILRISQMLKEQREEAELRAGSNPETYSLISVVFAAIEEALNALGVIKRHIHYQEMAKFDDSMKLTQLDIHLEAARFAKFDRLQADFETFKMQTLDPAEMDDAIMLRLNDIIRELDQLVVDAQLSMPDVLITMMVDRNPVAYAKIPVAEICFNPSNVKSGVNCGKLKPIKLSWLASKGHLENTPPSVLHARLWIGLTEHRHYWEKLIAPGKIRYYAELFVNEVRDKLASKFRPTTFKHPSRTVKFFRKVVFLGDGDEPYAISDESGMVEMSEQSVRPPSGWAFRGNWRQQRSHDMWVGPEAGCKRFEDEVFELQRKVDDEWKAHSWTGYFGDPVDSEKLQRAPPGWVYEGDWEVDFHCEGGVDGWTYSIEEEFTEKVGALDTCERSAHIFRRRRLKRLRIFSTNASLSAMYEDAEVFKKRCDEFGWEYATAFGKPLHMLQRHDDRFRRKRMLREIVRENRNAYKLSVRVGTPGESNFTTPRIYEVHSQINTYQLRVYILWARELVCTSHVVTRSYVRVFFMHRCQETAVIKYTTNPIFNETLIFDELLVAGGINSLKRNPPSIVVEVLAETFEGVDIILGRFEVSPTVISSVTDERAKIKWFGLSECLDNHSAALLMHAEMYPSDPKKRHIMPKVPVKKGLRGVSLRYEVPPEFRPKFVKYNVQILCWGMRNLQRFRMSAIRQPWLQISVADLIGQTVPLRDSKVSPNFDDPLLTFHEVLMPDRLYFAPPIQIALFDQRTFGMMPQVGVCTISNFAKYAHPPPQVMPENEAEWLDYDTVAAQEMQADYQQVAEFENQRRVNSEVFLAFPNDPNSPPIDWWCKYYFSIGELDKAPGYGELGLNKISIFKEPLEDIGEYRGFGDFLDTFYLERTSKKKKKRDAKDYCGELKGKLFITQSDGKEDMIVDRIPGTEFNGVVPCIVRIYIIRAYDLIPMKSKSGALDPYVTLHLGKRKLIGKYVPETTAPVFGQLFELNVDIPRETTLRISISDKKRLFGGVEIGETSIDLENRLLTKFRATVGMPWAYNLYGPLPWRDQQPPLNVLARYCRKMGLHAPKVLRNGGDVGLEVIDQTVWLSQIEPKPPTCVNFLGRPLQRVALFILHAIGLVPEHIETRRLFSTINPDMEVGKLECFIDIFPKPLGGIPPAIDITPRQPAKYQLRVVVWQVRNAILMKRSFGRPIADLYVRAYINGARKSETTDIHYRSLDGAGSFNWRFVFDFDYDPWEKKIAMKHKTRFLRKASVELVDPVLIVQICDNNKFKKDSVIGELTLPLLCFQEGHNDEDDMVEIYYPQEQKDHVVVRQCRFCCKTFCCCFLCCGKKKKKKVIPLPRAPLYVPVEAGHASLFQQKSVQGWWPCTSSTLPREQRMDEVNLKKKDDDYKPSGNDGIKKTYVTGMIELEFCLLPQELAKAEPVGRKRKNPNRDPFLPMPDRPKWDSYWCLSRFRPCAHFWWHKCGAQCVIYTFIILIVVLFIAAIVYRWPEILAQTVRAILQ